MSRHHRLQPLASLALFCLALSLAHASNLADEEGKALRTIATTLGVTNASSDTPASCNGQEGIGPLNFTCNVNCSYNSTCHVETINVTRQSLSGTLPAELASLSYLQSLDLSWNLLSGPIPSRWGEMPNITNITLLGNRLTGTIPTQIGNLFSLEILNLEANSLSGNLPGEIGDLSRLTTLNLASNYFTGGLPDSFGNLTALTEVCLSDNNFTGGVPDLIGNWTSLRKLVIQGSGFQGPIPGGIGTLKNLLDLRISDLNGPEAPLPNIASKGLQTLILRSCNLIGKLPDYLANFQSLQILDLSFNKFTGGIPTSYGNLNKIGYMFLTGNMLTGEAPDWILDQQKTVDLSYNNFSSKLFNCAENEKVNLYSYSSTANNSNNLCFCQNASTVGCKERSHEIKINCGGEPWPSEGDGSSDKEKEEEEEEEEGDYSDDDTEDFHRACFPHSNWGYSSTGLFMDSSDTAKYTVTAPPGFNFPDRRKDLYKDARVSPLSLTYFGYCLAEGNYTVILYFAEAVFTDIQKNQSQGRRFFDVYIQGKRVLKDFNIGAASEVNRTIVASVGSDGILEIRLYWAGKGTTAIPNRGRIGAYGPLISAISATNDYKKGLSAGAIVGIVAGVVVILLLALFTVWRKIHNRKYALSEDLRGLDLQAGSFTLRQIKAATNNFDVANKIGEGGFGSVYKGRLSDGTIIAVKQLSSKSRQGNREFVNEIGMISALQHPHLVKLYGCCIEGNQLLLVYEYMENNSLARALFGPVKFHLRLNWSTRYTICLGIARGLTYLHEESTLKIVHRDIKATNVLLDRDLTPKISDFGLAKLDEEENTHISTKIAGTYGYMAPEYAMHGHLTDKADVYSFGIVALEIVSGRSNTSYQQRKGECLYLLDLARILKKRGDLTDLIDPRLGFNYKKDEALRIMEIALLCTNISPSARPPMSSVVRMLEGSEEVLTTVPDSSFSRDEAKIEALRKHFTSWKEDELTEGTSQTTTSEPLFTPSTSTQDLYPPVWDSDYWEKRDPN